jgi:Fe-S-cluster-containing dehydrogenase component/CRP-like cAMP-binding protein
MIEITNTERIIDAIRRVEIVADLVEQLPTGEFKNELDMDVIIFGRNYNSKQVGPYVRLLELDPSEVIIRQGAWETNIFYILVEGLLEAYVEEEEGESVKVGNVTPGRSFGEMSVLSGIQRAATVKAAPGNEKAIVLEFTRPALRLLRKFPKFGKVLDRNYRNYGLDLMLNEIREFDPINFDDDLKKRLGDAARFVVYEKNHVLFRTGDPVNRLVMVRNGWIQRVTGADFNPNVADLLLNAGDTNVDLDFLGAGNCLGIEAFNNEPNWKYTATVMARTEVMEIAVARLNAQPDLKQAIISALGRDRAVEDLEKHRTAANRKSLISTKHEIETGLVDTTNLLIMDMDLCVRCGNCSLACHKVHGHSRLLRRGIEIERPVKRHGTALQHALVPSVCLHCQDPECMTGCPTGAIARLPNGQVDIDPVTCIGCGDCATQCPYNAISMIPRPDYAALNGKGAKNGNGTKNGKNDQPPNFFEQKVRPIYNRFFSLEQPVLAVPVTQTDNLLAVKCNLCKGTGLNPPGAKTRAYSCEENCPTGALVRVNPREYFGEVENAIGLIYKDQTHAIGRNIHKSDPLRTLLHVIGILLIALIGGTCLWATAEYTQDNLLYPNSWLTMRWVTALIGLGGIMWAAAYPVRKQIYRRRAGALRYWMLTHVYLGVLAAVLIFIHGGSSTGTALASLLMVSFDLVIASGIFGAACYLIIPRWLTHIEGEPLLLDDLKARREELRAKLAQVTQDESDPELADIVKNQVSGRLLSLKNLFRQLFGTGDLTTMLADAREDFRSVAATLDRTRQARLMEAVESAATLRRVDALCYLHQTLKIWVAPHVLFTALMMFLMVAHVVHAVYFNVR